MLVARALSVWLVMMGVEFCHGALRTIFLTPILGDDLARQVSVPSGAILIVLVAYAFIPWIGPRSKGSQLAVGFLWLLLTIAFDASIGHYIYKLSWERVAAGFNPLEGRLLPLGLVVLALSPMIATRLRERFKLR